MKDLWEVTGRLLLERAIPQPIWDVAKNPANFAIVDGKVVVNNETKGVSTMQKELEKAFKGLTCSLFTAGEVIRWLCTEDRDKPVNFKSLSGTVQLPANPSRALRECFGLILFDSEFVNAVIETPPRFGGFTELLDDSEKTCISDYVRGDLKAVRERATKFRDTEWEGGSCKIAYGFYEKYVHIP